MNVTFYVKNPTHLIISREVCPCLNKILYLPRSYTSINFVFTACIKWDKIPYFTNKVTPSLLPGHQSFCNNLIGRIESRLVECSQIVTCRPLRCMSECLANDGYRRVVVQSCRRPGMPKDVRGEADRDGKARSNLHQTTVVMVQSLFIGLM